MSQPARRIFRYSPSDTEGNMSVTTIGALHLYNGPELSSLQQHGVGNGRGTTFSQKPLGGLGQHTRPQPGTTFTLTRASNSNLQNLASNVVERDSEGSPPIMPRVLPSSEVCFGIVGTWAGRKSGHFYSKACVAQSVYHTCALHPVVAW